MFSIDVGCNQRGSRERTPLSKETYTVKHPPKIFPSCDVFRGVDVCVIGVKGFEELSPNHSPRQSHACVKTPENVTGWEYFLGVFDCVSFFLTMSSL